MDYTPIERYQRAAGAVKHELSLLLPGTEIPLPAWANVDDADYALTMWAASAAAGTATLQRRPVVGRSRVPVFASLFASETRPGATSFVMPVKPLALEEGSLFPITARDASDVRGAAEALLNSAITALVALVNETDPPSYLRSVDAVLRQYTWALPAPFADDVALYDYLRITAGIAAALDPAELDAGVMLVSGDISGVQSFIYTITARGATSGLRGRSLYLELLTDAITHYILRQLNLPPQALIYAGGAHFYLIAPRSAASEFGAISEAIERLLLAQFNGQLYLAIGTATFNRQDFEAAHFTAAWGRLTEAVNKSKRRRFGDLPDLYDAVFTPFGSGGDEKSDCAVCHHDGPDVQLDKRADNSELYKCDLCRSLEDLGRDIRSADYLLKAERPIPSAGNGRRRHWYATLAALGLEVRPVARDEIDTVRLAAGSVERVNLVALNDYAYQSAVDATARLRRRINAPVITTRRYLVNSVPLDDWQEIKSFEQLEAEADGIRRLGVLRMDVDDLGLFFSLGMSKRANLARTATLSNALALFFEGWVGNLAAAVDDGRNVVYSIYSGGDDLFIVGAWDVLPQLANRIAEDLQRYAVGNPHVHVSAGISLHGGKYPLYQAAEDAGDALAAAKAYSGREGSKNAINLFGRTFAWSRFRTLKQDAEMLRTLVVDGRAPTALLQRLQQLDALYQTHRTARIRAGANPNQTFWGPWHYRSVYALTRLARRGSNDTQAILALRDRLAGDSFQTIDEIGFSARWAELLLRKQTDRE